MRQLENCRNSSTHGSERRVSTGEANRRWRHHPFEHMGREQILSWCSVPKDFPAAPARPGRSDPRPLAIMRLLGDKLGMRVRATRGSPLARIRFYREMSPRWEDACSYGCSRGSINNDALFSFFSPVRRIDSRASEPTLYEIISGSSVIIPTCQV